MTNALIKIQNLLSVPSGEDVYAYVDAAIAMMEESGVNSLETAMEGDMNERMTVVLKMNEEMVAMEADHVISHIKMLYQPEDITMGSLTEKYR